MTRGGHWIIRKKEQLHYIIQRIYNDFKRVYIFYSGLLVCAMRQQSSKMFWTTDGM